MKAHILFFAGLLLFWMAWIFFDVTVIKYGKAELTTARILNDEKVWPEADTKRVGLDIEYLVDGKPMKNKAWFLVSRLRADVSNDEVPIYVHHKDPKDVCGASQLKMLKKLAWILLVPGLLVTVAGLVMIRKHSRGESSGADNGADRGWGEFIGIMIGVVFVEPPLAHAESGGLPALIADTVTGEWLVWGMLIGLCCFLAAVIDAFVRMPPEARATRCRNGFFAGLGIFAAGCGGAIGHAVGGDIGAWIGFALGVAIVVGIALVAAKVKRDSSPHTPCEGPSRGA